MNEHRMSEEIKKIYEIKICDTVYIACWIKDRIKIKGRKNKK